MVCLFIFRFSFILSLLFTIVSYNVENLFDCRHDSEKEDYDYLPEGKYEWDRGKYWHKTNNVARAIMQCGEHGGEGTGNGLAMPDVVGLVEVENDSVMGLLTRGSLLGTVGYRYLMTESRDRRGVDVALMYNPLTFQPYASRSIRVTPPKGFHATRDILYIAGKTNRGDSLHVFVVHAPSRSGGRYQTEGYRMAVARELLTAVDSVRAVVPKAGIVVMGDFNDYSYSKSLKWLGRHGLVDVTVDAVGWNHGKTGVMGTYKYGGRWGSLDHILLSPSLAQRVRSSFVLDNAWLLNKDAQHGGFTPRRAFMGSLFTGGVSDHLPLVVVM